MIALREWISRWFGVKRLQQADIDDLTQQSLLRLLPHWNNIKTSDYGLVLTILPQVYSRWCRQNRLGPIGRPGGQEADAPPEASARPQPRLTAHAAEPEVHSDPSQALEETELPALYDTLCAELSGHERQALDAYLDAPEKTSEQLAETVGVTPETFRQRLSRAREKVRKAIERLAVGGSGT
ncbi:MAG: hypothetical protein K2V38_16840 [Gemmataceae bacterium]|nr:hypothetical protein [Gemmataceae bacterium]